MPHKMGYKYVLSWNKMNLENRLFMTYVLFMVFAYMSLIAGYLAYLITLDMMNTIAMLLLFMIFYVVGMNDLRKSEKLKIMRKE